MMRMRTEAEIKAYVYGYNDCFKRFKECLKGRRSVLDAVRKMRISLEAVNNVLEDAREESREE